MKRARESNAAQTVRSTVHTLSYQLRQRSPVKQYRNFHKPSTSVTLTPLRQFDAQLGARFVTAAGAAAGRRVVASRSPAALSAYVVTQLTE